MRSPVRKPRKKPLTKITPEMWEGFFRNFQVPLFLEDASEVLAALDDLRKKGITDLGEWMEVHPEFITKILGLIRIIDTNDFAVEWAGARDKGELLCSLDRMILPETLPAFKSILLDLFAGRLAHSCECQYITLDGRQVYTWNQAMLPRPGDDPALVVISTTDITHIKTVQRELENSRDTYSRLVEAGQDVILCHDLEGRITFINQAGLEMTGWSCGEVIGRDVASLLPSNGPNGNRRKSLAHLGEVRGRTLFEAVMVTKHGREIPVEVNATVVPGASGNEAEPLLLAMIRDITDRKEAERKQGELEYHLKNTQKMESLGALAGGIAHDFNNLLVTIMGNTELLLSEKHSPQDLNNGLEVIMQASTQAADLCRQMQAYAGQTVATVVSADLNSIVDNMTRLLHVTVTGKAHLSFQLQPNLPGVDADVGQLGQVIMNLVINASDSLGEDGGEIVVRTGHKEFSAADLRRGQHASLLFPGHYVFCEVRDSGKGMNPETMQRLFDPFFTTRRGRRGLGMSSALGIIQSHQGGFLVESQVDKGTTITFLLPAKQDKVLKKTAPARRKKEPDNLHIHFKGKTVLSVDEDAAVRSVGEGFLRRLGCKVLSAGSGMDALRIFGERHQDIHAVLLDLSMEGMDGVETCRRLRVIRPDLPVVFSSGYSEEEVHKRAVEVGEYSFIPKPFRLAMIRSVMAEVMGSPEGE